MSVLNHMSPDEAADREYAWDAAVVHIDTALKAELAQDDSNVFELLQGAQAEASYNNGMDCLIRLWAGGETKENFSGEFDTLMQKIVDGIVVTAMGSTA